MWSVALLALGKHCFAECLKRTLGKSSTLLSAYRGHSANRALHRLSDVVHTIKSNTVSPTHGQHIGAGAPILPSVGPKALGKGILYYHVCLFFAECRHSANLGYAVCQAFAEFLVSGTRQRTSLPSARGLALGNGKSTRQSTVFR